MARERGSGGPDRPQDTPVAAGGPDRPEGAPHGYAPRLPELLEAVLSVGTDLGLGTTLQQIVDTASLLTDARYAALGVLDPESGRITELYTAGLGDEERRRIGALPDGHKGVLGALIHDPRPLRSDDVTRDPRSAGVPPGHPVMHTFLGTPVRVDTEVFGNLYLCEKSGGRPFTDADDALLRVLGSQAGIAISNARLYESALQRERWLQGSAAVTTALLTGTSRAEALQTVAEGARVLAEAAAGVILQSREDGGMEIVTVSTLEDPTGILGASIAPGSPVLVHLLSGQPVFLEDAATDPMMTTSVRHRYGPSMMLPLESGGRLIGTLALPRLRGGRPYTSADRQLATQFASQAALALVLADAQLDREQLAVYEDRDRIARDLHDLVVQRLFATEMTLESARRRAVAATKAPEWAGDPGDAVEADGLLVRAVDELDSTIQEVRTTIFALQQPPADAPTTFRGRVLRETAGASALLGFQPSVHFAGPVDALVTEPAAGELLATLRGALAAAHRRTGVSAIEVEVDATVRLPDGGRAVRLLVSDDGQDERGERRPPLTWQAPI
ncbi:GAF domain-containing protein [Streptomyces sp. NBC_00247]|uniref:GAF domain-containing sensor histidine kinase n=1 Tax=Streptomyces sp. NBC_00247 TaxID=2975689 RepID=UPI002E293526|nr:GAF domain-containing protein [Streptomyces sp. NBC_00247]